MWFFKLIRSILFLFIVLLLSYLSISHLFASLSSAHLQTQHHRPPSLYLYHDIAHTEIILPSTALTPQIRHALSPLLPHINYGYIAFSYGDRDFMLHTPHWRDTDPVLAFRALFVNTPALLRIGHYSRLRHDNSVIPLHIRSQQLQKLQQAILKSMQLKEGKCLPYPAPNRPSYLYYCQATHPYNLFYTCNQWSAQILRAASLPAPLWAPLAYQVTSPFVK